MKPIQIVENETQLLAFILIGLPGSGKSTWIQKNISGRPNFEIVSSDAFIERKAQDEGLSYDEVFKKYIGAATAAMKDSFRRAVKEGKNIVWDQTNLSKKKRKSIINGLPDTYLKVAVVFDIDDRELKSRLDERAENEGKSIPDHVMKSMLSSYQPVTKDEGFDKIIKVS